MKGLLARGKEPRRGGGETLGTRSRHLISKAARACRALVVAALVVPGLAHGAAALDSVVFQANWLIQGENAYMVAGRDKGFYRDEGIDLDIKRGFGSGDTVKKVVGGAATVGTADMGVVMLAIIREQLPVKCISAEYSYSPQGFWVLASSDIKSIKDLAGKRAGVTPGNSLLVYFPLIAKANDLEPSKLTFVTMEASALLPTLLAGQIDAMPGFATVFELRNAETSAQGKPLRDFPFAKHGLKVYGECQLVTETAIKGKPDLIARYMRATQKSVRWALANPEEAAHLLSVAYPELKEASVLVNHKAFMTYVFNETSEKVGLGGFDLDQVRRTFEAVKSAQNIVGPPEPATFIDTRFLAKP
jgi:NitT/TauT family transport system substrate-binding protein